jgi:hypothetical protein
MDMKVLFPFSKYSLIKERLKILQLLENSGLFQTYRSMTNIIKM